MEEVTFKYSMIKTDVRPNKRLIDEVVCGSPSDPFSYQDGNPRPLKRRKNDDSGDEEEKPLPDDHLEECEEHVSSEDVEVNIKALMDILSSCEELTSKASVLERALVSHQQEDCVRFMDIIRTHIGALTTTINERKSFYSLWVGSSRPLKNLNLGFYGLLPVELIYSIFKFVSGKELLILSQVCSLFHEIVQDESLWKALAERSWPVSITLGQKPENRTWKWLFKAKTRTFKPEEVREGVGCFVLPYGNLYEGEWRSGKRHGQGTGIMKDGRRYDGQWDNDMRCGFGIFRWPLDCGANGGDTYVGEWRDSKRHGPGVYTWVDGTQYDGQWGDGKREGQGCVVWPDGRKYVGEYKDGKMEGKGVFTWPDQSIYIGDYINGKRHGKGRYTYSNGGIYEGEWENGMRHGKGTLWKSTGEKYEGHWKWNAPFGLGTVTYKDGRQVEKQWIEDELLITP